MEKGKAGMFVDVQNVQVTFEKAGNEVRYDKLLQEVTKRCEKENLILWKSVAFVPFDPRDQRRERLINALSFMGYRVKSKQVKRLPDGSVKANMDMEITLEILAAAEYLDMIVIVSDNMDDIEGVIIPFSVSPGKWEEDFFNVSGGVEEFGGGEDLGELPEEDIDLGEPPQDED